MSKRTPSLRATMIALALAGLATGQALGATGSGSTTTAGGTGDSGSTSTPPATTTTTLSPGQTKVAGKFAAPFAAMAGSQDNAVALATALRTGTPVTLTHTATVDGAATTTTTTFTPPTKPMGWGNVSHSLALAQFALAQQGITSPSGDQLQAALTGGDITTADGTTVTLAGVLQQRADGMGWGKIAQSYGTTMGAVNRGIKAPTVTASTSTPTTTATAPAARTTTTKMGLPTKTTWSAARRPRPPRGRPRHPPARPGAA